MNENFFENNGVMLTQNQPDTPFPNQQYTTEPANHKNEQKSNFVLNLIGAILGIIASVMALIGIFLPLYKQNVYDYEAGRTKSKNLFFWNLFDYLKKISKETKNIPDKQMISVYLIYGLYAMIFLGLVIVLVTLIVSLIRQILAIVSKKSVSRILLSEGAILLLVTMVLTLFTDFHGTYDAIYGYVPASGNGVGMTLIFAAALVVLCTAMIIGVIEGLNYGQNHKKAYIFQVIFNIVLAVLSAVMIFMVNAWAVKYVAQSYDSKVTIANYGSPLFIDFVSQIVNQASFTTYIFGSIAGITGILVFILSTLTLISAVKNIVKNYRIGNSSFVRAIASVAFLITMVIMLSIFGKKLHLDGVSLKVISPIFIVGLIVNLVIIILYIVKFVIFASSPAFREEVMQGTAKSVKGSMIRSIILCIILSIALTAVGILFGVIDKNNKKRLSSEKDSYRYDDDYDDYDYDDYDYDDYDYDY